MLLSEITLKEMSSVEIEDAEDEIKRLFLKVRIIINFSNHFDARLIDGAKDEKGFKRDNISHDDLIEVFNKLKDHHDDLFKDAASYDDELKRGKFEGVIQDVMKNINVPFGLSFNKRVGKFVLACKTIMKRNHFHVKPSDHVIKV